MVLTIAMMAIGMLMLAATPGYAVIGVWAQVLVIAGRLIQGFALGGEVGPSTAYLLEAAPSHQRGFIASWQIASQGIASLLAGTIGFLLAVTLSKTAMQDWGWRIPFLVGIAIVPVGLRHPQPPARDGGRRRRSGRRPPRPSPCSSACCAITAACFC